MPAPLARRNPMLMPFIFLALGVGLIGWYGLSWYELPQYNESDIAASIEANLAVDLSRRGPNLQPDAKGLERMRAQIRDELTADIDRERADAERGIGIGLFCIVIALGHAVLMHGLRPPPK